MMLKTRPTAPRSRLGRPPELFAAAAILLCLLGGPVAGRADELASGTEGSRTLLERLVHLRAGDGREWAEFAEQPDARFLEVLFQAQANASPHALELRQYDVKHAWRVVLNGRPLGRLVQDEDPMVIYLEVPRGALEDGDNRLLIEQLGGPDPPSDDIRVGRLVLHPRHPEQQLSQSVIEVEVTDHEDAAPLPCRLTIVADDGWRQTTGLASGDHLAVRPGVVYTATGKARIPVPSGRYTVYAGRGFEYSLASVTVDLQEGEQLQRSLSIRREVPTTGYVASDTHLHTVTYSGHGDATIDERMITIAGEGIELPIATDHNVHVDYDEPARRLGVRQYFTPVIGNEVTTPVGHFNVFPVRPGAAPPEHRQHDWNDLFREIFATPDVRVVILNHGRDVHAGTRPLGPGLHNHAVGENLAGWPMRFNAMEVVNSGATQSDPFQLLHDWMGLLNRGYLVAPIGSSDSHDVARYIAGQGRTYIWCDDRRADAIDVDQAIANLLAGRVMVGYGLLAELRLDGRYRSGDTVPVVDDEIDVQLRVLGPHWVQADRIELFANGQLLRSAEIDPANERELPAGVKWEGSWVIPRPRHDQFLTAIASGPGIDQPYWTTAKPYQPTSIHWESRVIGCSGPVWLDVDGSGRFTPARHYAERIVVGAQGDLGQIVRELADYDAAVAAQAAHLYQSQTPTLLDPSQQRLWRAAAPAVQAGFHQYLDAWRQTQLAR